MCALLLWSGHCALAAYFVAPASLLADRPIDGADFDTHIGQTWRVVEGLRRWGKPWVYDVQLLAGQPEGTIFDADNKGWEVWTYLGTQAGMSQAHAFNSFVAFAQLVVPAIVALAAALFGLSPWACLLAGMMGSSLWFFDSWAHWTWWIGMVSYAFASVLFLLPLALFYRFTVKRSRVAGGVFAPMLALCHLLHPYTFFMLVVPLTALYLRVRRDLTRVDHALVVTAVVVTCLLNAFWLLPAREHWHYILSSAFFGRTGLRQLAADLFGLLLDPSDSGVIGTRTGFRFLYLGLSLASLAVWSRLRDARRVVFGSAGLCLFVLGYLGAYVPGADQLQPYRHVLPLSFLACVPAAAFFEHVVRARALVFLNGAQAALFAVLSLATLQLMAAQVLYFMPDVLPKVANMIDGTPVSFSALGHPNFPNYRIPREVDAAVGLHAVADWVSTHIPKGERVLVEEAHLGEHLAWKRQLEVLGGFRERNIEHARANFFRHYAHTRVSDDLLVLYMRTYAVRWVITQHKREDFEAAKNWLEPRGVVEGRYVYRSRLNFGKILDGGGSASASTNLIQVKGSTPTQPLVLSYHYHPRLRCEPSCSVEREPSAFDDVGLVRVPAPHPADLAITLRY
ncbi:MAG: hypothetical protein RL701_1766 [Pseudomonadota bacterium]